MADGWARATHTPGVCTATCGPGVTQLATALVTAARAQSPLVAFVGESPTTDEEYVQRFDQSRFAEACEAGFVRVLSPDTAYDAVRKAFYLAKLESRPIMLSAPDGHPAKDDGRRRGVRAVVDDSARRTRVQPNPDSIAARRRHHRQRQQTGHHRRPRRDVVGRGRRRHRRSASASAR